MMMTKEERSKMGRRNRNRGARAERELANLFRERYGIECKRGQVFNHQSDLVGLPFIHPEVKRVEKLNVYEAMHQAIVEAGIRQDGLPAVFHRKDRTDWLVTMRLEDWVKFYQFALENDIII